MEAVITGITTALTFTGQSIEMITQEPLLATLVGFMFLGMGLRTFKKGKGAAR